MIHLHNYGSTEEDPSSPLFSEEKEDQTKSMKRINVNNINVKIWQLKWDILSLILVYYKQNNQDHFADWVVLGNKLFLHLLSFPECTKKCSTSETLFKLEFFQVTGFKNMEVNQSVKKKASLNDQEINDWLPITSKRNAKWWYSAFHNVTAMVGAGVLGLPYAMSELGWYIRSCLRSLISKFLIAPLDSFLKISYFEVRNIYACIILFDYIFFWDSCVD